MNYRQDKTTMTTENYVFMRLRHDAQPNKETFFSRKRVPVAINLLTPSFYDRATVGSECYRVVNRTLVVNSLCKANNLVYHIEFATPLTSWLFPKLYTYPKYSKHWPSTVAHTIVGVCSKISNHGWNHRLLF